jgi:hypothetical protein
MESFDILNIEVDADDIFEYVIGNSCYCPIETQIDCERYATYDPFIYDSFNKEMIHQDDPYVSFCTQVSLLKARAPKMSGDEIHRICVELEEISPKTIKL